MIPTQSKNMFCNCTERRVAMATPLQRDQNPAAQGVAPAPRASRTPSACRPGGLQPQTSCRVLSAVRKNKLFFFKKGQRSAAADLLDILNGSVVSLPSSSFPLQPSAFRLPPFLFHLPPSPFGSRFRLQSSGFRVQASDFQVQPSKGRELTSKLPLSICLLPCSTFPFSPSPFPFRFKVEASKFRLQSSDFRPLRVATPQNSSSFPFQPSN